MIACITMTVTDHLAQSLKSNDLTHFTDFYPRRSCNVRPTNGVNALISMSCWKSDDEYDDDDDESFYRIRRRGLSMRRIPAC